MKQVLIVTARPDDFKALAQGFKNFGPISVIWAGSMDAAAAAVTGKAVDLAVIDETVNGAPALKIAKEMLMKNVMVNQALVSRLSPEAFHEMAEGLGILAQLPSMPDAGHAGMLMEKLNALTGR